MLICRAINKHGRDNFLIEQIDTAESIEELNRKESYHADRLKTYTPNGYNVDPCGGGIGKMREEVRLKHSKTYTLISPDNEIVTVTNLYQFAVDNGLNHSCLNRVGRGERASHKGWRTMKRKQKAYHFEHEKTGEKKIVIDAYGFKERIAKEMGTTVPSLWAIKKGKIETTMGWRMVKVERLN